MPLIKSATKRMRQDRRRYARNLRTKRAIRTAVKAFEAEPNFDNLREAQSKIDTAVKKHVLTKKAAARRMSHLSHKAKVAGVKIVAVKKSAKTSSAKAEKTAKTPAKKAPAKKPAAKSAAKKSVK